MRPTLIIVIFAVLFAPCLLYGQPGLPDQQVNANKNWIFGQGAGMSFTLATPATVGSGIIAAEGTASVSDAGTGQLLLYATLDTIWDRNGNIMPNAAGLLPSLPLNGIGLTGGCDAQSVIVPFINDPKKYYVFSLTSYSTSSLSVLPGTDPLAGKLYYSVVDMNLNGGFGDVVPGQKGILIDSLLCDRLVAVRGGQCNAWLLSMRNNGSAIHAFEITGTGISNAPVVSVCNTMYTPTLDLAPLFQLNSGSMRVSPDNSKLAVSLSGVAAELILSPFSLNFYGGGFQLYDFDNNTGLVTNQVTLVSPSALLGFDQQGYGVCFSPDNTKLYFTHGLLLGLGLAQYDITSGVAATIAASAVQLNSATIGWGSGMRLGTDDKIYVSGTDMSMLGLIPSTALHRIDNPNLAGLAANLNLNAVNLVPGSFCGLSLGNPTIGLPPVDSTFNVTNLAICAPETSLLLSVPSNPAYTYLWNDGSTGTDKTVFGPGIYWVMHGPYCPKTIDTFKVEAVDVRFSLGPDTIFCTDAFTYVLSPGISNAAYVWQDGSTLPEYTVTEAGQYYATVSRAGCTASDTANVIVIDINQDLGNDTVVCAKAAVNIRLEANAPPGASVLWSTGSTDDAITVTAPGLYSVTVRQEGCEGKDFFRVSTEMCDCITGMPNAFSPNGDGLNDIFKPLIEPGCAVAGYLFQIYDRWGKLVFSTTTPGSGWDGNYKQQALETGTYMFTLSFEKGTEHHAYHRKGDLTLIR